MPLFNKKEHELENRFEKWVYFLKNLESFHHIPSLLNEPIFQKGFEIAQLSHLSATQYEQYQKSLIQYWDVKNVTDTAFKDDIKKGELVKAVKIAKNLLSMGLEIKAIATATGLCESDIENL